ncbi:MAG TPA: serine protease [Solirubrobacteraceae bacterium]
MTAANGRRLGARLALLSGAALIALWGPAPATAVRTPSPQAHASVIGGTEASIADFPFQVALYDPQAGSPAAGFFCGGVILDADHIATAAHCLLGGGSGRRLSAPAEIEVLAGSSRLSPTDPGSIRDPVANASYDSRYNPFTSDYDIGLLTLSRRLWNGPAPKLDGVDTIAPLPASARLAEGYGNPNEEHAIVATTSGWGDTSSAPGEPPSYPLGLRSAHVSLASEWLCDEEYRGIEQAITPRMICAGEASHRTDSCYGDSGGPLVVDRDAPADPPSDYVLVGLVDFGNGCAQAGYPGVYSRISDAEIAGFLNFGGLRKARLATKRPARKKHRRR